MAPGALLRAVAPLLLLLLQLRLSLSLASATSGLLLRSLLPDGELQTWIAHRGITAKETSVPATRPGSGLVLRQVIDGHHFLQLIYSDGVLVDCDESPVDDEEEVDVILQEVEERRDNGTAFIEGLPSEYSWLDMPVLRVACRDNHRLVRRRAREQRRKTRRPRRSLKEWFMLPGTNWCGPSNIARAGELGPFGEADRCCKRHDRCRLSIPGFSGKYNKFNARPFTLSHCRCDRRFRTCLKVADTGASNLVGKLFFNVVSTKCFVVKPEKVCVKTTWWGKCQRFEYKKQAVVRSNLAY